MIIVQGLRLANLDYGCEENSLREDARKLMATRARVATPTFLRTREDEYIEERRGQYLIIFDLRFP